MTEASEKERILYDAIIVGGGFSGLTAAYTLLKKSPATNLLVLEAKDRVGGRTFLQTLKCAENDEVQSETTHDWEMGGMWVGRCQPHIMGLLEELGIGTYKQYIEGTKCMKFTGDDCVHTYQSNIPSLGMLATLDIGQALFRIQRLIKSVPADNPWLCNNAEDLDSMTMESLSRKYCFTAKAQELLDTLVRAMYAVEASQVSALSFLADCSAAGGNLEALMETTEGSSQELKIKGGSQAVCTKLVEETITWDRVRLNSPVERIIQEDDRVIVQLPNGDIIQGKYVIMATPPTQNLNILFTPRLPYSKLHLYNRMPVGHLIKTIITYKKAYWKEKGYSGEVVTTDPQTDLPIGCTAGPVGIVIDATSEHGHPALVVFTNGRQAQEWGDQEADVRRKAVLSSLAEFYQCEDMLSPLDYGEKDWAQEPYNGGCPGSTVTPGVMRYYTQLREPHGRIEFAGTESATEWSGFLDGAVQAGQRAALNILAKVQPQSSIVH